MINSDNEISDSEIISTGIPYSVPVYRYDELTAQIHSPVGGPGAPTRAAPIPPGLLHARASRVREREESGRGARDRTILVRSETI